MSSNETISDKLLRAIDAAIDDGNYEGIVALVDCWQRLVPSTVWSRLGLTQPEAEVVEEIAAATADCACAPDDDRAPDEPLKVGDRVRFIKPGLAARAKVGDIGKIIRIESGLFDVAFNGGAWLCGLDQIERVEPEPERLKFGQWVRGSNACEYPGLDGIVVEDDGAQSLPYRVFWEGGASEWCSRAELILIEPQS